jgi:hypothetical protein
LRNSTRINLASKFGAEKGNGTPYINYFLAEDGMIVFGENFLTEETNPENMRLKLTSVVGQYWIETTKEKEIDPASLKMIVRANISGKANSDVVNRALQASDGKLEFFPGDDGFYAILATDNGKGIPHFLSDWKGSLDYKSIQKIRVIEWKLLSLVFFLESTTPEPEPDLPVIPSPLSRKEKRKLRATSSQYFEPLPSKQQQKEREFNSSP